MQHLIPQPSRLLRPFLIALCLSLGLFLALDASAGATGRLPGGQLRPLAANATTPTLTPATTATAPAATATTAPVTGKGVELAKLATVRVVATYSTTFQNTPLTRQCSGLGVLVQSTDPSGKQGTPYLLTTNQVLSKQLCPEATANLPGIASLAGSLKSIDVFLSSAYSATPVQFSASPTDPAIADNRTSPQLVLVPLTPPANATHDYPTATLSKQGSASTEALLDLKNASGARLTNQQLNPAPNGTGEIATTYLTPDAVAAPFPALDSFSPGAPVIDRQTGEVLQLNYPGGTPLSVITINQDTLPNAAQSCPKFGLTLTPNPCLSAQWANVLDARANKDTTTERALLQTITSKYTDFTVAQSRLNTLPAAASPGVSPVATQGSSGSGFLGQPEIIIIALVALVVLFLLVIVMAFLVYVQRLRKRQKREQATSREAVERSQPFMPRTPSGQLASAGFVASASGAAPQVAPGAPTLPYAPSMQNIAQGGRTITCANCGAQNNAGSSVCFNCGHDLAQAPGAVSGARGAFPPSTSGGPARLSLPSLSQPPVNLPPIPAAPEPAAQAPQPSGGNVRAPYQGANQDTEPAMPALSRSEERTVILPGRKRPAFGVMVSSRSDRGRKRAGKDNEDNYLAVTGSRLHNGQIEPFGLFVVADGMGGHANGQDASRMAIESIYLDLAPRLTQQEVPDDELTNLLQQAIQSANQKLYRQNQQDHADMGCTMTAALVSGDEAHICNVGDSRTYLLHPGGELQRVTVDHSIVQSLVDAGVIQKDDVYTHPKRNQIYRSLGEKEVIEIDTFRQRVAPGDKLLLCCDGLWEMIRDNEIEMILSQTDDLPQASAKLIEMANEHGGVDNITAIVVKVTEEKKPAKRPGIESVDSGPSKLPNKRAVG